mmetsp:Transcript_34812/g.87683  ORF Transcript_34812/g.87683 Transcript_34812/m.87683 type:complete len:746 (-) Transcript_34812:808-3045(-)
MPLSDAAVAGGALHAPSVAERLPELLQAVRSAPGGGSSCEAALAEVVELCKGHGGKGDPWKTMLDAGAVPLLVGLLRAGVPGRTQELAARAIDNLQTRFDDEVRDALGKAGAMPLLVALIRGEAPESPQEEAASRVIYKLAVSSILCSDVEKSSFTGAVPALVALIQERKGHSVLRNALGALCLLTVRDDDNENDALAAGVAPALLAQLEHIEEFPICIATLLLQGVNRLALLRPKGREAVLGAGAVSTLLALLQRPGAYIYHAHTVSVVLALLDLDDGDDKALLMNTLIPALLNSLATWPHSGAPSEQDGDGANTDLIREVINVLERTRDAEGPIARSLVTLMRSPSHLGRDALMDYLVLNCRSAIAMGSTGFIRHLLILGAASDLWSSSNAMPPSCPRRRQAREALESCIADRQKLLDATLDGEEELGVSAGLSALACAVASTPGTLGIAPRRMAVEMLSQEEYAQQLAQLILQDSELGASARRDAARLSRIISPGAARPTSNDDSSVSGRPAKRPRTLQQDFDRDIPGSLCFLVAGRQFFGCAHLIRSASCTLREAIDRLPGGDSTLGSAGRPLPVAGPASIPEDRLHALFLACMRHAHCDDSVAELGEAAAALWECARWLQMEDLMEECEEEVGRQLRACASGEESVRLLEEAALGMLRGGCQGKGLPAACGAAMVRWADSEAMRAVLGRIVEAGAGEEGLMVECMPHMVEAVAELAAVGREVVENSMQTDIFSEMAQRAA